MIQQLQQLAAGMGPDQTMRMVMRALPPERRSLAAELGSLLGILDEVPPPDPPPWALPLFARWAAASGLSAELLASTSYHLTGYNPSGGYGGRVGLMGLPPTKVHVHPNGVSATIQELKDGDRLAAQRVASGLSRAAQLLSTWGDEDGVAAAVLRYVRECPPTTPGTDPADVTLSILSGSLVLALRSLGDDELPS